MLLQVLNLNVNPVVLTTSSICMNQTMVVWRVYLTGVCMPSIVHNHATTLELEMKQDGGKSPRPLDRADLTSS